MIKIITEEFHVGCTIANPPQHNRDPFIAKHTVGQHLPLSEEIGARMLCPTLHPLMTDKQNEFVCAVIIEAVGRIRRS